MLQNLLKETKASRIKELIVEKKNSTHKFVKPVSIGYGGIKKKIGKIPKKSKILEEWNFVIGLISKDIPKALNITSEILGVSSAYKVFGSIDKKISKSWFIYRILDKNWKKYLKSTSRQGQGFDANAFLNEIINAPLEHKFNKIEKLIKKILTFKNNIEKLNLSIEKIRLEISYNLSR